MKHFVFQQTKVLKHEMKIDAAIVNKETNAVIVIAEKNLLCSR